MGRGWIQGLLIAACLLAAACTTTDVRRLSATRVAAPSSGVVVLPPDVTFAVLSAIGENEARPAWDALGRTHLKGALDAAVLAQGHRLLLPPVDGVEALAAQERTLSDAILARDYRKRRRGQAFEWALPEDMAQALARDTGADYALFVHARGDYGSTARAGMAAVALSLGGSIGMGRQFAWACLIDLRTGQVVWFNVAEAGLTADARDPAGASLLVEYLLKGAPL